MSEPHDSCHPVILPSGETVRVRGVGELDAAGVAALGELVAAARRMMSEPDEGAAELYARVDAVRARLRLSARECARAAGIAPSTFSRLAQGRMPDGPALAAIECWLKENEDV